MNDERTWCIPYARRAHRRGVALVVVLAVLTIMALLALVFSVLVMMEASSSSLNLAGHQAAMIAESGREHAIAMLSFDAASSPGVTEPGQFWRRAFQAGPDGRSASFALGLSSNAAAGWRDARWIEVKNERGALVGRYAVLIEDEAGKINVNAASATSPDEQRAGVGTFELMLANGGDRGVPLSVQAAKRAVAGRYGADGKPGRAGFDDNFNAAECAGDELDNDADGFVDEQDEGIDDPAEYDPARPRWDDKPFASVGDFAHLCAPEGHVKPADLRQLESLATTQSKSTEEYWDIEDGAWHKMTNPNVMTRRQLQGVLARANMAEPFEKNERSMRGLISNLMDYRDYNSVLTTVGSEYGVEAICFNEIVAHDGSFTKEGNSDAFGYEDSEFVYRFGQWYNPYDVGGFNLGGSEDTYGWKVTSVGGPAGSRGVLVQGEQRNMPSTTVKLGGPSDALRAVSKCGEFLKMLDRDGWVVDMWKNGALCIQPSNGLYYTYPLAGNDSRDTLTVCYDTPEQYAALAAFGAGNKAARIETFWHSHWEIWCVFPEQTDKWVIPVRTYGSWKPPRDLYYYVQPCEGAFPGNVGEGVVGACATPNVYSAFSGSHPFKGYCRTMDVDGDPSSYSESQMPALTERELKGTTLKLPAGTTEMPLMIYNYLDRRAVRARNGLIPMTLTSSRDCGTGLGRKRTSGPSVFSKKSTVDVVYCMRPDVIELINVSHRPISVHNWRVVINTGSYADELGVVNSARRFNVKRALCEDDPNPAIAPGGYFYLTNNRFVFDSEYGNPAEGEWGSGPNERNLCFELPDYLWGMRYKVTRMTGSMTTLEGADWQPNQMQGETVEWLSSRPPPSDRNAVTGTRKSIIGNTRNAIDCYWSMEFHGVRVGDDALIIGLPRSGGFVSMTLKNEYGQITARTVEYGSVGLKELGMSTEKFDPTHYTWIKSQQPTIGGTDDRALNQSCRAAGKGKNMAFVKNNNYASIAELQRVRTSRDWENVGSGARGIGETKMLRAVAPFATMTAIRLDPEEEGVTLSGWLPAFGRVRVAAGNAVSAREAAWTANLWQGQTLRFLSGVLKGECFRIASNSVASAFVSGYSVPNDLQLKPGPDDLFALGPGYVSALFYSIRNGDVGIWEWKNKPIEHTAYGLYLFGLNDSIKTTEFLEENNNAEIEVAVYNYATRSFDALPSSSKSAVASGDAYDRTDDVSSRFRCDKNDGMFCGMIGPDHVSADSGIKLRITPRSLDAPGCSGMAWFDYACLVPASVVGKININTASPRVLTALNGVTPALARSIASGSDPAGRARLKPYRSIASLLDVGGMTVEQFGKNANLVTTRSDQFKIRIRAEVLADVASDGVFDTSSGDRLRAVKELSAVVERVPSANMPGGSRFRIVGQ